MYVHILYTYTDTHTIHIHTWDAMPCHYITLHCITFNLHYITLHYITLHCIALHYITLHYIAYISTYVQINVLTSSTVFLHTVQVIYASIRVQLVHWWWATAPEQLWIQAAPKSINLHEVLLSKDVKSVCMFNYQQHTEGIGPEWSTYVQITRLCLSRSRTSSLWKRFEELTTWSWGIIRNH